MLHTAPLFGEVLARTLFTYEGGNATHLDDWLPVLFHPHSARPPRLCHLERYHGPIHTQNWLQKCRHLLGIAGNVMADQCAAKAVGGCIRKTAMDQSSMKEEHIARVHQNRMNLLLWWEWDRHIGKTQAGIGLRRTEDGPVVACGNHLQASVGFITLIQCEPSCYARSWLNLEKKLILMECLTPCLRWLKVEHRLHRIQFLSYQEGKQVIETFIQEPAQADFIPTVHVNHAWIALERIFTCGINANQIPWMRSLRAESHIVFAQQCHLVRSEELARNGISLLFIGAFQIQSRKHNLTLSFAQKEERHSSLSPS